MTIRAGLVLGGALLIASASACTNDGSDAKRCENDVINYLSQENMRKDGYRDSEIRTLREDPQFMSSKWEECMFDKGWMCDAAFEPIQCTTETDGPVASPFG
jgi:hypothetical protein